MYYGNIKPFSIENGTGVRVSLFVSGCRNCCRNCFSRQTWDFCYGELFTEEVEDEIIRLINRPFIEGLTVLGGEPMEPENQRDLLPLLRKARELCPDKSIWIYTGFRLEKRREKGGTDSAHMDGMPEGENRDSSQDGGRSRDGYRSQDRSRSRQKGEFPWFLHDYEKTGALALRADTEYLPEILRLTDILVDGRFEEDKKNLLLSFRGSENQRIICMPETLESGEIVLSSLNHNGRGNDGSPAK